MRKADVIAKSKQHASGELLPEKEAGSYVVFAQKTALIAKRPPLVAVWSKPDRYETWQDDPASQAIRRAVLGDSPRHLRIANAQRPHRHIRRALDDPTWPRARREALALTDWQADEHITRPAPPAATRSRRRRTRC